jgi:small-conductance mechanosensitive channel
VWIDDANESRNRTSDLHEAVWWALKEQSITIAYPQLDLHLGRPLEGAEAEEN